MSLVLYEKEAQLDENFFPLSLKRNKCRAPTQLSISKNEPKIYNYQAQEIL